MQDLEQVQGRCDLSRRQSGRGCGRVRSWPGRARGGDGSGSVRRQGYLRPGRGEHADPASRTALQANVVLEGRDVLIQAATILGADLFAGPDLGISELVELDQITRVSSKNIKILAAAGAQGDGRNGGFAVNRVVTSDIDQLSTQDVSFWSREYDSLDTTPWRSGWLLGFLGPGGGDIHTEYLGTAFCLSQAGLQRNLKEQNSNDSQENQSYADGFRRNCIGYHRERKGLGAGVAKFNIKRAYLK